MADALDVFKEAMLKDIDVDIDREVQKLVNSRKSYRTLSRSK